MLISGIADQRKLSLTKYSKQRFFQLSELLLAKQTFMLDVPNYQPMVIRRKNWFI